MSAASAGVRREQRRCTPEAGSSERRLKKSDAETTPGGSVCRAEARLGSWDPEHEGRECQQGEERREGLEWEQGEEREGGGLRGSDVGGALRRDSEELGAVAGARQGTNPPSRGHRWVRGFFFSLPIPLLCTGRSPRSIPCRSAPWIRCGDRLVRDRVVFSFFSFFFFFLFLPKPCVVYRQLSEFYSMQVWLNDFARRQVGSSSG